MSIHQQKYIRGPTVFAAAFIAALASAPAGAAEVITFSEDIFPIIQFRCVACHQPEGEGYQKSGLDLRTYQGLMKGTKFGAMVIPGDAFRSNLMVMLDKRGSPEIRMPHGQKPLTSCDRDLF